MPTAALVPSATRAPPRPAPPSPQARDLIPSIPYIQAASLSAARGGVFVSLLAPSVTTGVIQMSRVRRGLDAVERMYQQAGGEEFLFGACEGGGNAGHLGPASS